MTSKRWLSVSLLTVISLLQLTACGQPSVSPTTASSGPEVAWIPSDDKGASLAKAEHRARVVDVHATWCPNCQHVQSVVLNDPRIRAEIRRFVPVSLDVSSQDGASEALASKYNADALPAIRVFDASGKQVAATDGRVDVETLLAALRSAP